MAGLYDLATELGVKIVGCDRELRGRKQSPHESCLVYLMMSVDGLVHDDIFIIYISTM